MNIIETIEEFDAFLEKSKQYNWILVPFYCNGNKSVYTDMLFVLYVYVINLDEEVMIVFNHTEGLSLPIELLNQFPKDKNLFVYNKKRFKRFLDTPNFIDMSMVEYFYNNQSIEDDFETTAHEFFTRNFGNFSNLNTIIPITKHIEKAQAIAQRFLNVYDYFQNDESFQKYNELILDSLFQIEKNGLLEYVDVPKCNQYSAMLDHFYELIDTNNIEIDEDIIKRNGYITNLYNKVYNDSSYWE